MVRLASIIKKKKGNNTYYYVVESKRVNGKPRIVWQKYLGTIDKILFKMSPEGQFLPHSAKVFEFGASAALWDIAQRLRLVETIDSHVSKRQQGLSVGQYMLLAALNRCVAPTSKRQMADWYESTVLRRLLPVDKRSLNSQRFWDNMQHLDATSIEAVERSLNQRLVEEFQLDLEAVVYDTTNFFTYIDTLTDCELPQRGHSKEKRRDLRIVGLALMVTMDFHIPLFHDVYRGNQHDSKQFASVTQRLVQRYQDLAAGCDQITLIYDKGNNAKTTQSAIEASPYHFVGSLKPADHRDLVAIPQQNFTPMTGSCIGELAYCTTKRVFGQEYRIVVTYNETLFLGQLQGVTTQLRRANNALKDIAKKLEKRRLGLVKQGTKPTSESVKKQVEKQLQVPFLSQIIEYSIDDVEGVPQLRYSINQDAFQTISSERFGKTILFTDHMDWSPEQVVAAYRGQHHIEDAFKVMKNPHVVSWKPMYHWTDHNIRVHAFYCVLALTLVSLLRRELHRKGIDVSIESMLRTLEGIEEVAHIYAPESRQKPHFTLTEMEPPQQAIYEVLGLQRYAPGSTQG